MNICHCGAQDGYPHDPRCPFPLYHDNPQEVERWRKEWRGPAVVKDRFRRISNKELADLPSGGWENNTIDDSKYYQNVLYAFEVDRELYLELKAKGHICRFYQGKYYVA